MSTVCVIIPARIGSSRLARKPLAMIAGKPLVMWVWEKAQRATRPDEVLVATDSGEVEEIMKSRGARVVVTPAEGIRSGTERCAFVAANLGYDYYINLQCDQPFIDPSLLDLLAEQIRRQVGVLTLATPIVNESEYLNPNVVKVVRSGSRALYFSRAPIPVMVDGFNPGVALKHIGVYAFSSGVLRQVACLPASTLERFERLEQLRWIEHGVPIAVEVVPQDVFAIDTPEQLAQAREMAQGFSTDHWARG